jgi:DNA-binding beta-propeller fold protein YncE
MALTLRTHVAVPRYEKEGGEFDHGDVDWKSGDLFIAHPSKDTVEIIGQGDGKTSDFYHQCTIAEAPQCSGVIVPQGEGMVFVACRSANSVKWLDAEFSWWLGEIKVGAEPNGLAWDPKRKRLFVSCIKDRTGYLTSPKEGTTHGTAAFPGRPRWVVYDPKHDRYLQAIQDPAVVVIVDAKTGALDETVQITKPKPHGIAVDDADRAFIACDSGALVVLDLKSLKETATVALAGKPNVIWYNAKRDVLYLAIEDTGVVEVIDLKTMKSIQTVPTEVNAKSIAFDPTRQRLYSFFEKTGRIAVFEES